MKSGSARIDTSAPWDKRDKSTHRFEIADVNGPISLTVPVVKPQSYSSATLGDIRLSTHGDWPRVHRVTLESAYGRTPYFEFVFPRFEKFFHSTTVEQFPFLWQYLAATTACALEFLQIDAEVKVGEQPEDTAEGEPYVSVLPPYWQPRADRFGFLPGLSILDLIFNLGPEASLYLRKLAAS